MYRLSVLAATHFLYEQFHFNCDIFDVHLYQCHNYCHVQYFLNGFTVSVYIGEPTTSLPAFLSSTSLLPPSLSLSRCCSSSFVPSVMLCTGRMNDEWNEGISIILAKHATASKMLKRDSVVVFLLGSRSLAWHSSFVLSLLLLLCSIAEKVIKFCHCENRVDNFHFFNNFQYFYAHFCPAATAPPPPSNKFFVTVSAVEFFFGKIYWFVFRFNHNVDYIYF